MFSQTNLLLALAASASAHLTMMNPKPFNKASLTRSPLAPADFPCKQRPGVYSIDEMNQWNAGETQVVKFEQEGTAVHGGGSCQFSITTDPEPTKDSEWKVIQSVIGDCPSNATGNLPEDGRGLSEYPVTMPSNIPEGRYTFAWTWLNKVGAREFYMNCAPIQVGSGSGAASTASAAQALSALPNMFVANLPNTECSTTEQEDFVYPDPGQNVVKGTSPENNFASTLSKAGCNQGKKGGSPSGGTPPAPSQGTPSEPSSAPTQPQIPAASPSPVYGAPQQSNLPSNPGGGVFAPGASPAPNPGPAPEPSAPAAQPAPPAADPAPSAPQAPADNNTAPGSGGCTPCTNEGAVVCIGTSQFGLCNHGCAVPQALAAGMSCSGGAVVASTKRHLHFPRAHLHRRFSAARF